MTAHTMHRPDALHFSNNEAANGLAARSGTALLIAFQLDQQQTVQKAFEGPQLILERLGTIEPAELAALPPEQVEEAFRKKPAVHRFPANMAKRVQAAMQMIVDEYDGDTDRIWLDADDFDDVMNRIQAIPGLGPQTAMSLVGVLAQRFNLPFTGWEEHMPAYGSLGSVDSMDALEEYQQRKREYKAKKRAAAKQ